LIVVEKIAQCQRLKALVLDSVSSPITKRVYNMALDEFMVWFRQESRPGFTKATVSAWRASLEARGLGSSSIIIRMSAIRKLAGEAADNGRYLKESGEMCRLLSAIQEFPASKEERLKIIKQRLRENEAQMFYNSVRQELFKLADWD
jgi:hypothetical protein